MKQRYKQYFYENMKVTKLLHLIEADDDDEEDLTSKVKKHVKDGKLVGKIKKTVKNKIKSRKDKKRKDAIIKLSAIKDELQKRIDTIYDKYTKEGKKKDLRVVKSENEADAEQIQKMKDGIDLANEKIEKLRSAAGIEDEEEPKEDSDDEEKEDKVSPKVKKHVKDGKKVSPKVKKHVKDGKLVGKIKKTVKNKIKSRKDKKRKDAIIKLSAEDKKKEVEDKIEEIAGEGDIERLKSNLKMIDLAIVKLQVKLEASSTKSERENITQEMFKLADRKEMFEKRIEQLENSDNK